MKDAVDQALKLSREIMKLEQQERTIRAKREEKRDELARLLAGERVPVTAPDYRAGSMTSKIVSLLSTKYPESLSTEAIAATLNAETAIVRSTLSRLKAAHQVESPNRGQYRAVTHEEHGGGEQN